MGQGVAALTGMPSTENCACSAPVPPRLPWGEDFILALNSGAGSVHTAALFRGLPGLFRMPAGVGAACCCTVVGR